MSHRRAVYKVYLSTRMCNKRRMRIDQAQTKHIFIYHEILSKRFYIIRYHSITYYYCNL